MFKTDAISYRPANAANEETDIENPIAKFINVCYYV